jgi:Mrp family chromosome partitioning ATPase
MIVAKAVKMAEMMNIPILGIVENMSYFKCPECEKEYKLFGDSHLEEIAQQYGIKLLARIPIDPQLAQAVDKGQIEDFSGNWLDSIADNLEKSYV